MILDPYDPKLDFYRLLEVSPSAPRDELRRAFYRRIRQVHPDLNGGPRASTLQTQRINRSKILLSPALREAYDRLRLDYWIQRGEAPPGQPRPKRRARPSKSPAMKQREAEAWTRLAAGFVSGLMGRGR